MEKKSTGLSLEYVIPPCESLRDILEDRGMSQNILAVRTGMSSKHISDVMNNKASISPRLATALENVFGVSAQFWLNLQNNYDIEYIKAKAIDEISPNEFEILKNLASVVKYMQLLGLLAKGLKKESKVLFFRKFLGVNSLTAVPSLNFNAAYRKSSAVRIDPFVLYSWIKICESLSQQALVNCELNVQKLKEKIQYIRTLMLLKDPNEAVAKLTETFADCGIKFGVIQHITGAPVNGFIEKTKSGDTILFMTIRLKSADIFWFTLFHEIAHILNGDVNENAKFIDYEFHDNEMERRADNWARDVLINPLAYKNFIREKDFSILAIKRFSRSQGIFPGILIGRMQKEKHIPFSWYTKYKLKYEWEAEKK